MSAIDSHATDPSGYRVTAGPWEVNAFGGEWRVIARMQPHEVAICSKDPGGNEIETARLMAAAPELLAACEAMSAYYSFSLDWQPPYVRLARAALEKARG